MNKNSIWLLCLVLVLPTFANGQKSGDGDYGIFQNEGEYHQFMGDLKRSVRQNPEMKGMIPFINDVVLGRDFGWTNQKYGGESNSLGMLSNAKIRADLEMDDDQYEAPIRSWSPFNCCKLIFPIFC